MRYVNARFDDFEREETYRIYVTKSLQLSPQKGYIQNSYYDIIHKKIDTRSGDDVAIDIMTRAGLSFG